MKEETLEQRLTRLEAKQQVMAALLHALAATHPDRESARQAFQDRYAALAMLWQLRREELTGDWFDAVEAAALAAEKALGGEFPGVH